MIMDNKVNPNFRLKAIAEFLDGNHFFNIPSYQRGYRWDKKQVEDLLKDIWDFARNDEKKKSDFYCLQPVVVKKKIVSNEIQWIVIDGQQRLTTLYLLLDFLKKGSRTSFVKNSLMYDIKYDTRTNLDFLNPVFNDDIDSFHVFQASSVIEKWFEKNEVRFAQIEDVLFLNKKSEEDEDKIPQVVFIWYVAENEDDIDSIKVFNHLNKGKIRLTNAELIKALFILKSQEKKNDRKSEQLNIYELSYEWNEIENALHDNRFWYFLAKKEYNPATRIDIIFDFLTEKAENDDADFSYRKFQNLYDKTNDSFWSHRNVNNFTDAWKKVKEAFHTFLYWYEDSTLYHYIGFLLSNNIAISDIYKQCVNLSKSDVKMKLQYLIRMRFFNYSKTDLDGFSYSENYSECKTLLLFYNIETCVVQQQNQNKEVHNSDTTTYYKFPFDIYKLNNWDIEHVGSRTDNHLTDIKDKIIWLNYIPNIVSDDLKWPDLKEQALILSKVLTEKQKDDGEKFKKIYDNVCSIFQKNENDGKDTLDNLTLLDTGTNRGYGNALFPTKRQTIIENDTKGVFIPPCTKNLFLKYYSKEDTNNSWWKNRWEDSDRKEYLKAIHHTIDFMLK